MGKLLLILTTACLFVLIIGTMLMPDNSSFWLASGALNYQLIRLVLASILMLQLVTNPPRNPIFRTLTALLALATATWTLNSTYAYQMEFADTLAFLGASLAIGITALEYNPDQQPVGRMTNKSTG